jgi:hypothetical protein
MIIHNSEHHFKAIEGRSYQARIYNPSNIWNKDALTPVAVSHVVKKAKGQPYLNSIDRRMFLSEWHRARSLVTEGIQRNAATGYDAAKLSAFVAETMLDIQRLADDMSDFSSMLYNVINRPDASKKVSLVDLLPFVGKAAEFGGTGDLPNLIEHNLGITEDVLVKLYGFGDKSTLNEILWSPNYDQLAVSAARIIADERNKILFKPMVEAVYDTAHSAAFSSGGSPDENLYLTIKAAYKKLLGLTNPLSGRKIGDGDFETVLFVNRADAIDVRPIVEGELANAGGLRIVARALPIDHFIEYSAGLNHGRKYQGEDLSYPGVPSGKAYLAAKVPDGAQLVKKVDWNMEVQPGTSQIKGEEKYWWSAYGCYNENVLPSTANGVAYGAIIEIELAA